VIRFTEYFFFKRTPDGPVEALLFNTVFETFASGLPSLARTSRGLVLREAHVS